LICFSLPQGHPGCTVGVFVSTVFSILTFFSQTVVVYQSYTGG